MRRKTLIWLIKYYPIVANLNLLMLLILQLFNVNLHGITGYMVGCVVWPTIILVILSKELNFCAWHRVLLYNLIVYAFICVMDKCDIEFNYYIYTALIFNIASIVTATILYSINGCYRKDANKRTKRPNKKGSKRFVPTNDDRTV
jgi:hypothetical protein